MRESLLHKVLGLFYIDNLIKRNTVSNNKILLNF